MKIQVLGGSGFIGTKLIGELVANHQVINLDKNNSPHHQSITKLCDVTDDNQLKNQLDVSEWVVLLAAEHRDDVSPREKYYDVNVEGAKKILAAIEAVNSFDSFIQSLLAISTS